MEDKQLQSALDFLEVKDLTRQEWIEVGMALKAGGFPCSVWDEWSKQDPRYHKGECTKKWAGFNGSGLNTGSIIHMAEIRGWSKFDGNACLDWDDVIEYDGDPAPTSDSFNPRNELRRYILKLFDPSDHVSYVTESFLAEDGKYKPAGKGTYFQTAEFILNSLEKHEDIRDTIGDYNSEAGVWIRFNPVDGKGVGNHNVTSFKYALVESDSMDVTEQELKFRELQLPIALMVNSGGKSLHAIVKVDATNIDEYKQRVSKLYSVLESKGCTIDKQNSNPSRLSRMPGVERGKKKQYIVAEDVGRKSWNEWLDFIDGSADELPDICNVFDSLQKPIVLPPELIKGVLRKGHKMLIAGASKAGKSYLLIELCAAIASGSEWCGMTCEKGKVLYINLEIDPDSCINRFNEVFNAIKLSSEYWKNIDVWNLRGYAVPMDKLVNYITRRAAGKGYSAIIIDPIYKVITGDENNASDMAEFCRYFDEICAKTKCSVIYCHHHSKGAQGGKKAADRASGSGVFARDPDAQLDLVELVLTSEVKNKYRDNDATAWRIESSLREFKNIRPVNIWFDYPLHKVDDTGQLEKMGAEGSQKGNLSKSKKRVSEDDRLDDLYGALDMLGNGSSVNEVAHAIGRSEKTIRNWFKNEDSQVAQAFYIKNGLVFQFPSDGKK